MDLYHGKDYLDAVLHGDINEDDMAVMLSIDGAQLYQNKQLDCWIWIWIIFDYSLDMRYKKKNVLIGSTIPGPNKPKNSDSYLYPSMHHVAAIQKEGLKIWDARRDVVFTFHIYLTLATADGPGMTYLNGLNGHQGALGCCLYCLTPGRCKPNGKGYYPCLLKPDNYTVEGCNHSDISATAIRSASKEVYLENLAYLMASASDTEYKMRRKLMGISKPSLFSGLPEKRILGIPGCFPADLMHLVALNLTDLLLSLWCGTMTCKAPDTRESWEWYVLHGETWTTHGKQVANATSFLPGSFDHPPCNPAEKISSGYKAWEYLMYVFAMGPAIFHCILPNKYWEHFCKLVAAIRIMHQHEITTVQLCTAHVMLVEFVQEFEDLYYQCKPEQLHFHCQSIHALLHLTREAIRLGPQVYYTQWTMERSIGNLGKEIKQPSNPYKNLSHHAVCCCQVNALKAMIPDLEPSKDRLPRGAKPLGDGYCLLRAKDSSKQLVLDEPAQAIQAYYEAAAPEEFEGNDTQVIQWAHLSLPNGQIARSAWKERLRLQDQIQTAHNVKVM